MQRTLTENERLRKEMLERLRRFDEMITRMDQPQQQERHTHKPLGPSVTSQGAIDLASNSNKDVTLKHKKELEKPGSRIKVAIPTTRRQTDSPFRDPRTTSPITFGTDQGKPEALLEQPPVKEKQASLKEVARHGGCEGGQRHTQGLRKPAPWQTG